MKSTTIAVVSDSITGPFLTALLEKRGFDVQLISTSSAGVATLTHANAISGRIQYFPVIEPMTKALEILQTFFVDQVALSEGESSPITFESGEQKPFVGFGDNKSQAVHTLSKYYGSSSHHYNFNPKVLNDLLSAATILKSKAYYQSEISELHFNDSKIEKITINGSQEIHADTFIFLNSPKDYMHLIPSEYLGTKTRSRIAKTPSWARVALCYESSTPLFSENTLIFMVPDSEVEPCVGSFRHDLTSEGSRYVGIWETYVDQIQSEDPEFLATTLKGLRRWSKKAVPALESGCKETILINPFDSADYSWVFQSRDLLEIANNLIISNTFMFPSLGLAQSIMAACAAITSLDKQLNTPKIVEAHSSLLERVQNADTSH